MTLPPPSAKPRQMTVTFHVGQPVRWPVAYLHVAQVDELRRTRVRLVYVTRKGRTRFSLVGAGRLAAAQVAPAFESPPLAAAINNPLGRGARPRSKTFEIHNEGAK